MIVKSCCFLGMLLGVVGFVVGDEMQDGQPVERPGNIELTTEQVVVFKDGYCLVVKDGVAKTDENGFAHTYEVPGAAVLGSFWAIPENGEIKSMVAGWEEIKTEEVKEINCTDVLSIIKAQILEGSYFFSRSRQASSQNWPPRLALKSLNIRCSMSGRWAAP